MLVVIDMKVSEFSIPHQTLSGRGTHGPDLHRVLDTYDAGHVWWTKPSVLSARTPLRR